MDSRSRSYPKGDQVIMPVIEPTVTLIPPGVSIKSAKEILGFMITGLDISNTTQYKGNDGTVTNDRYRKSCEEGLLLKARTERI